MKLNYKAGIWFWTGAGVYSLMNMFKNYNQLAQSKVLFYDSLIFAVAIIGFILTLTLFKRRKNYKSEIWFWVGSGVYSLINMIMNYKQVAQSKVLFYDSLIFAVAIFGFILNFTLLKIRKNK